MTAAILFLLLLILSTVLLAWCSLDEEIEERKRWRRAEEKAGTGEFEAA